MKKQKWEMIRKGLPVLLFSLLLLFNAQAGNAAGNNSELQGLLALGLAENLGLQAIKIDSLQAGEETVVQDARFDPELFASASHSENRSPAGTLDIDPVQNEQSRAEVGIRKNFSSGLTSSLSLATERVEGDYEYLDPRYSSYLLLNLQQPLLRGSGLDINTTDLKIARNQQLQSQYLYLKRAQDLALQIEVAYYDLIKARHTELLREESRQLVVGLLEGNRAKLDAGVIPISEVQEAETALADRDLQLALSRQAREQVALQLDSLINNSIGAPKEFSAGFSDLSLDTPSLAPEFSTVYTTALEKRADLRSVELDLKSNGLRSDFLSNQTKADLDLVLSAGLNGLSGDERDGSAPVRNSGPYADSYDSMSNADGYQWSAGLVFSYPLGNRAAKARSGQAQLEERRSGYRKQELEQEIETEIRQRLTEMKRIGEQFTIAERLQSLADTSLKQEGRRLSEGLSDTFRILTFQGNMIDARIARLSALVEYNKSLARFNLALGTNLERHGIIARIEQKEIRFENM